MAEKTNIEWTDHTFNPVRGCTKVSAGCANCYAARDAVRFPGLRGVWGDNGTRIVAVPAAWKAPVRWNRDAESVLMHWNEGNLGDLPKPRRPRVFCASLADVFEDWRGELRFPADLAPEGWVKARWDGKQLVREFEDSAERQELPLATMDNMREELFALIEATPFLDWQLLTKRPENVMSMVPERWRAKFPANVWMGTTVENQTMADLRIPQLLTIPARIRFLSMEPLLGTVDLSPFHIGWTRCGNCGQAGDPSPEEPLGAVRVCPECLVAVEVDGHHLHWVIAGGESGPGARPSHPDWFRSLRDQIAAAEVPFFFKQWGEWTTELDADGSDPDGRADYTGMKRRGGIVLNLAGGCGFHGERVHMMKRVGKKAAGRELDRRTWDEFPAPA